MGKADENIRLVSDQVLT